MKKKNSGFTLLEMIIVLAITLIVMGIVTSIFITGNRVFSDSDVKTDLQMDAKDIQERISNICMQASSIESVAGNKDTGEITNLQINSYDKDGKEKLFEIKKDENKLDIDGYKTTSNISSMKIDSNIVKVSDDESELAKIHSIKFNIELEGKKGFSEDVKYPLSFTVTFRN